MYPRTTAVVALLVASLGFAPAPVYRERPDPKGVLKQLQGTWELKTPPGRVMTLVRIKGDTWNYVFVTNGVESEGSPSRIVLGLDRGLTTLDLELRHPVPGVSPVVLRSLVKIEGDRLSVCYSPATNPKRPRTFAGTRPWLGVVDDKDTSPCTMSFRKLE